MRELNVNEIQEVNGGVAAGDVAVGYGAAILGGAVVGFMMGGPAGMLVGAVTGASRVAISGGIGILAAAYFGKIEP
ncbi:Blp family class II bacteriocin [Pseudoalteromonas distincta]|uniref:Class IIb bacteriocin, lactobin A/cerein 7B family n=1 Tax=Pseudoalteromonas distincta TaxID=77608 RepID=A0A4P9J3R7_9GAMM|nr:hypothetical protein [Pseudoalteromonas distincta]QCU75523.1 hypothetical protein FFU37_14095 [Pseudoalteromonas distincta]